VKGAIACDLPGGGHALFTTGARENLSTLNGPGHERGRLARDQLCADLGLRWLCASRQVHGTAVQRVRSQGGTGGEAVAIDADGHATSARGLGMTVLVADCLPVALASGRAVAMLHAGWRGLAAGVLEEGIRAVRELGGEAPIAAVIGPGAGSCCYEVGGEVHAALGGNHRPGGHIDLRARAPERRGAGGGVDVLDLELCTICDERFFSHRREGALAGRQAGVAWRS